MPLPERGLRRSAHPAQGDLNPDSRRGLSRDWQRRGAGGNSRDGLPSPVTSYIVAGLMASGVQLPRALPAVNASGS